MPEPPAKPSPDTEVLHRDAERRVQELEDRLTEVERQIEDPPPAGEPTPPHPGGASGATKD